MSITSHSSMERGLRRLNQMSESEASRCLTRCCGSTAWAIRTARHRPYGSPDDLERIAGDVWWSLDEDEWLEAFASHPEIGDQSLRSNSTGDMGWSTDEQSGARGATSEVDRRLAEGNISYKDRFGFIFIISAVGKNAEEILGNLESRLDNDRVTELRIAAKQQLLITKLRLAKLLDELGDDA